MNKKQALKILGYGEEQFDLLRKKGILKTRRVGGNLDYVLESVLLEKFNYLRYEGKVGEAKALPKNLKALYLWPRRGEEKFVCKELKAAMALVKNGDMQKFQKYPIIGFVDSRGCECTDKIPGLLDLFDSILVSGIETIFVMDAGKHVDRGFIEGVIGRGFGTKIEYLGE